MALFTAPLRPTSTLSLAGRPGLLAPPLLLRRRTGLLLSLKQQLAFSGGLLGSSGGSVASTSAAGQLRSKSDVRAHAGRQEDFIQQRLLQGECTEREEVVLYWREKLDLVSARRQEELGFLHPEHPFGIRLADIPKGKTILREGLQFKHEYPKNIIFMASGKEYYYTYGLDAELVLECCNGLKGLQLRKEPAYKNKEEVWRLAVPRGRLRDVLACLNKEDLVTAIVEVDPSGRRFLAGTVSKEQPEYLYGSEDSLQLANPVAPPPVLGIAHMSTGYLVVEVSLQKLEYAVHERLLPEVVKQRRLDSAEQKRDPVYKELEQRCEIIRGNDPVRDLLNELRMRHHNIAADESFTRIIPDPRSRPLELGPSTVQQLGFGDRPVRSLLDAVLPKTASQLQRATMEAYLKAPPPPEVAADVRAVCAVLAELVTPQPQWTVLDGHEVNKHIRSENTTAKHFRDVASALGQAHQLLTTGELQPLAEPLLPVVDFWLARGSKIDQSSLAGECRAILAHIDSVIQPEAMVLREPDEEHEKGTAEGELRRLRKELEWQGRTAFRGRVLDQLVEKELREVDEAAGLVDEELRWGLELLTRKCSSPLGAPTVQKGRGGALLFRVPPKEQSRCDELVRDKEGPFTPVLQGTERTWTGLTGTSGLDGALEMYREACENACAAVRAHEQELARRLKAHDLAILRALACCLWAALLDQHTRKAMEAGWGLPEAAAAGESLQVTGMSPYDMQRLGTVRNDVELEGVAILTGPNMGGKSTVLRSVCAVALLATCGLYAPVEAARVPPIVAFWLRAFAGDAPAEQMSAFAMEAQELGWLQNNARAGFLVLMDEFGISTDQTEAGYIFTALVEELASKGCWGIFSTHMHKMLNELDQSGVLDSSKVSYLQMESLPAEERAGRELTYKIVPGMCTDSQPFDVLQEHSPGLISRVNAAKHAHTAWLLERAREQQAVGSHALHAHPQPFQPLALSAASDPSAGVQSLDAAQELLQEAARQLFGEEVEDPGKLKAVQLPAGLAPPPPTIGGSFVYVLRTTRGGFYVGETDKLTGRMEDHRHNKRFGRDLTAAYLEVPRQLGGKTTARELERQVILKMKLNSFPLLSDVCSSV